MVEVVASLGVLAFLCLGAALALLEAGTLVAFQGRALVTGVEYYTVLADPHQLLAALELFLVLLALLFVLVVVLEGPVQAGPHYAQH